MVFEPKRQQYGLPVAPVEYAASRQLGYGNYGGTAALPNEAVVEEPFDPLKLLWYVVHYRWIIAALLAAGVVSGVLYTWAQTPLYRATANVEILNQGAKVIQEYDVVPQVDDYRAMETARLKIL